MNIIGVECNADRYFFGRLFKNKNLIRKERNDLAVIKGVLKNNDFNIGIIDVDKNKKIPSNFRLIDENKNTQIYKQNTNCQFLILIGPRQFEHWINEFLKDNDKTVEHFGFGSFNEFMEKSKSKNPEKNEKFKNIINYILDNYESNENHILKLKKQLVYLIDKKYQFNEIEFLEI